MALQAPENISINQNGSQLDISPSTCLCHSNRARSLSWIFWTLLSSSRKEAVPHYSPESEKELDSFISKARLGDILSYVPDITKLGQRTNLTKILEGRIIVVHGLGQVLQSRKRLSVNCSFAGVCVIHNNKSIDFFRTIDQTQQILH